MDTEKEELPLTSQSVWRRARWRGRDLLSYGIYLFIGGYIIYSLIASIGANYSIKQDISTAQVRIDELNLTKAKLQSLLVYYETSSFQERELRRRLLLKRPGEIVVALASNEPLTEIFSPAPPEEIVKSPWQEWYDYYVTPTNR